MTDGSVAPVLEALGAVVPTGIAVTYSGAALLLRGLAVSQGADERAVTEAKLAKAGKSAGAIRRALEAMPAETTLYLGLRIGLVVIAVVLVAAMAWTASVRANRKSTKKRKVVLAEPLTAVVAFGGWSPASPGTPLAVYLNPGEMVAYSAFIVAAAGMLLFASGQIFLRKPASAKH